MKKKLLIILLSVYCICCTAQRDFHKGFIITNKGDTVFGWVDYRGDIRNSKTCLFKKAENDQSTEYSPNDIAAYRFVAGKFYVSKNVGTEDDPHWVFFEYLVNGMANVYYYRDTNKDYYYLEKGGNLIELKKERKEIKIGGKRLIKTYNYYIGVLKATLNVREMNNEIEKSKLDHKSLINIAKDYHQYTCTDGNECIVYEGKKPLIAARIGPVIGGDLIIFQLKDNHDKYDFSKDMSASIGANVNFWMPWINEKLFLQLQVLYTQYRIKGSYQDQTQTQIPFIGDVCIRSNILNTGLALKYEYPKKKWQPTIAVGGVFSYWANGKRDDIINYYPNEKQAYSTQVTNDFPAKSMFGFEIIPGVHYHFKGRNILFFQFRYAYCFSKKETDLPIPGRLRKNTHIVQSIGLSTGMYF